ncbi:MAG: hypothetical protein AB7P03_07475 [Kofleriaceae bacterium]
MRFALIVAAVFAVGCKKSSQEGLPPATEWRAGSGTSSPGQPAAPAPAMGDMGGPANPHGMTGNPHAGVDMSGANPHGAMPPANPHAGGSVADMGLQPPDPSRKIDPNRYIRGTIKLDAKAKGKVKPGTAVFLVAKRADASGAPSGPPLAVSRLTWDNKDLVFELTEADAMIQGTEFSGDVIVTARYDQDSEARTKEPGDITGEVRVKVPAANVKIVLNTIL